MTRLSFGLSVMFALCVFGVAMPAQAQNAGSFWYRNNGGSGYSYVAPRPHHNYGYWNPNSYRYSPRYDNGYWYQNNFQYSPQYYRYRPNYGYGYTDPNSYRYYYPGSGYVVPPQYRSPGYYGPSPHAPYGGFQPDQRSRYWNYGYQGQPTYPRYYGSPRRRW